MPSKQAKQNKQDRKSANKAIKLGKTDKQRKQRLANKVKRDAIHAINPDIKITVVNGITMNIHGEELKVVDDEIITIKKVGEHIPLDHFQELINNGDIIPIDNAVADEDGTCAHGNALSSNCSDCFDQEFKDAESYKDDLTPYATGETTAVKPAPKSMWNKLKNKWEGV